MRDYLVEAVRHCQPLSPSRLLPFPSATSANPWSASFENSKPSAKAPRPTQSTISASPFAAAAPSAPSSRRSIPTPPGPRCAASLASSSAASASCATPRSWTTGSSTSPRPRRRPAPPQAPSQFHRHRARPSRLRPALRRKIRHQIVDAPRAEAPPPRSPCSAVKPRRAMPRRRTHRRSPRSARPRATHRQSRRLQRTSHQHQALCYTVENLLPNHYVLWSKNLKRLQDILGDVHDLDVLSVLLKDVVAKDAPGDEAAKHALTDAHHVWQETIHRERSERIETYRQLTLGKTSSLERLAPWPAARQAPRAGFDGTPPSHRPRHRLTPASHRENFAFLDRALRRLTPRARRSRLRRAKHAPRHARRRAPSPRRRSPPRANTRAKNQPQKPRAFLLLPMPQSWTYEKSGISQTGRHFHRGPDRPQAAAHFQRSATCSKKTFKPIASPASPAPSTVQHRSCRPHALKKPPTPSSSICNC